MKITIFIFYRHTKEENVNVSLYLSHKIPVIPEIGVFATERETDVWISKL